MSWFSIPHLASRGTPTAADKALKAGQQAKYVKELWILIASIIAFLALSSSRQAVFEGRAIVGGSSTWTDRESVLETVPAALASVFKVVAFRRHIPIGPGSVASITELLFILGYMAAMISFTLVNTENLDSWFFEDRAAHLASCQLPFIVALAGKNNIISFFTGIGHEKLNILHRAAARTCLILLWIHAICRASSGLPEQFDFSHGWMRWGVAGLAAFTLTTILSIRPVRNMFFEFFLLSHIALVGIFLVGGYLHAREPGWGDYIWPALVVWAFDRVLRFSRLLWNNRGKHGSGHEHTTATVELITSDTIRLTLRRRFDWSAGQHAYVILPTVSDIPTEAHPFTIASISKSLDGTNGPEEKDVVFLIRGRTGFTGRLRDYAERNGVCTVPAFVDGPYGCPPDLTKYSLACGSGVSYTLPLLLDLVHNAHAKKSSVRRVVFVWAVRDADHLEWISKVLTEALASAHSTSLVVEPNVYVTGPDCVIPQLPTLASKDGSSTPPTPVSESVNNEKMGPPVYSSLKIIHGRPSIRRILQEEVNAASGPVSVDVSGPSALSQAVSRTLASSVTSPMSVLRGSPSVTLHVETFGMVR
ncbi:putative ferric reductase transmembrane component [Grifola frondosa]|uniref:ferric-chelate reductase (NADPH) n=1 Tax=Grifola frondosa TaxID=5627 RepID=A0A1C7MHM8_GRIFR|nr:putative ferric reductase transmembrane component [Grifola frondosa]